MKGLLYQLKSVRKDKFCIMSFLLPIVVAVALNFVGSIDLSSLGEFHFGVTAKATTSEVNTWLERYGTVTVYPTQEELIEAINEPSTNLIGVEMSNGSIQTILSGDELDMFSRQPTRSRLFTSRGNGGTGQCAGIGAPGYDGGLSEYLYCHYADRGNVHGLYL